MSSSNCSFYWNFCALIIGAPGSIKSRNRLRPGKINIAILMVKHVVIALAPRGTDSQNVPYLMESCTPSLMGF